MESEAKSRTGGISLSALLQHKTNERGTLLKESILAFLLMSANCECKKNKKKQQGPICGGKRVRLRIEFLAFPERKERSTVCLQPSRLR